MIPPLPPAKDVLEALQQDVLPGAGGAALVVCVFALLGRWAGALGSAVAVVLGVVWGNVKSSYEKLTWEETWRLRPWKLPDDADGRDWLLKAALLLVVVGLLSRWLGLIAARVLPESRWWGANLLVWAPRVAAVIVVSGWLTVGEVAQKRPADAPPAAEAGKAEETIKVAVTTAWPLLRPQLALAMLLLWVVLDSLARAGAGAQVAAYQGAALLAAGAIILYAHSAKSAELAILLGSAMFGVAVATAVVAFPAVKSDPDAWRFGSDVEGFDASGAVPAGVAFLPALLFGVQPWLNEHTVPPACFWLVALAPLVLLPFVLPPLARKTGWYVPVTRAVLVLAPIVAALVVAGQHAQMAFEE